MNNTRQQGFVVIAIAVLVAFLAICGFSYVSAYNYGNKVETRLSAILENNENIYAQGTQKILEMAQVPDNYASDLAKITKEAIDGRYGPEDSRAVVQAIQEHNPTLDTSMYHEITRQIDIFRSKFEANQTTLIDVKRPYIEALGSLWQGMWLRIAGYPKIDLKKFDIVSTSKARKAFDTKIDDGIQLRPAK